VLRRDLPCSPCYDATRTAECRFGHLNCMRELLPDEVYGACVKLLQKRLQQVQPRRRVACSSSSSPTLAMPSPPPPHSAPCATPGRTPSSTCSPLPPAARRWRAWPASTQSTLPTSTPSTRPPVCYRVSWARSCPCYGASAAGATTNSCCCII